MTEGGRPAGKGQDPRQAASTMGRAALDAYGRAARIPTPSPARPEAPEVPDLPDLRDREELITECLPLVKFVAHRISSRLPSHVEVDDLIHSGILGLMDAVRKFEPDRNVKFKTYAEQRIRGAILDGLRDLDWVPRSLRRKKKDIEAAYHLLEQQHGRAATDEEVAAHLGLALDDLHHSLDELKGVTLGAFVDAGENGEGENLISFVPDPDGENPHILLQAREVRSILKSAVDRLPTKERFVVQLYYFEELTMKEIGTLLNITESRVSQLHTKSMLRLRGKLKERRIDG
ncbi:FliA/WhiG family RNA polymerase sigma factor [Mesoterricola sediminis]|uniref:RNA polymerase sigma factor n=1 Tax=Mesoterricola sediminis TaxID=2927980 RepID=A0AA48H0J7_9BACT|nr:FliA/WhiG family RNA polymerase sigma factor [Mesoterricola sediminis]BDU77417.1 DNA-directed RNA polymerase sigma-70 factor [Mesoterricola sediminis]